MPLTGIQSGTLTCSHLETSLPTQYCVPGPVERLGSRRRRRDFGPPMLPEAAQRHPKRNTHVLAFGNQAADHGTAIQTCGAAALSVSAPRALSESAAPDAPIRPSSLPPPPRPASPLSPSSSSLPALPRCPPSSCPTTDTPFSAPLPTLSSFVLVVSNDPPALLCTPYHSHLHRPRCVQRPTRPSLRH